MDIAERIRRQFAERSTLFQGQEIEHTLCCGIAEVMSKDWQPGVDDLMQRADAALYQAKAGGRNQSAYFYYSETPVTDRRATRQQ